MARLQIALSSVGANLQLFATRIIKDDDDTQPSVGPSGGIQKKSNASRTPDYVSGQYSGYELARSHKLNKDPIMELKHIIGFQPDMCR